MYGCGGTEKGPAQRSEELGRTDRSEITTVISDILGTEVDSYHVIRKDNFYIKTVYM